jgi:hypothetical protein
VFQDGSCECPKQNHRRPGRVPSETMPPKTRRPKPTHGAHDACAPRSEREAPPQHHGRRTNAADANLVLYRPQAAATPRLRRHRLTGDSGTTARRVRPPRRTGRGVILREKCTRSGGPTATGRRRRRTNRRRRTPRRGPARNGDE